MAVDKNKIIAEATRLVQRGALDKAIAAYQRVLAADPKDVRVLLKVGELHQRKGDARPAAEAFTRVAETYADQGFFLKAIAVYKQIVRLDQVDVKVNERLAALYQQLGLMSDAMVQLQLVAAGAERAGDQPRLVEVLRRMVEIDPDNVASTVKLGELHARADQVAAAADCFQRAAAQLKRQGRTDEYVKVAERLAAVQPGDLALTRELAHLHLARGDTKRALAKLQLCYKADPGDAESLHLLARAFGDLGQQGKVVSVYRELAHLQAEQGRHAEARATWQKVAELVPGDEEAAAALEEALPSPAAAPPPPPAPLPAAASVPAQAPPPRRAAAPPPARTPAPSSAPEDPSARLLAEADVYAKYGLHDRALQHLAKLFELDPGSPDAHERARDLHAAARRPAEAARAGAAAVRALHDRGEPERARQALERLRQLAPDHPELTALAAALAAPEEVPLDQSDLEELEPEAAPSPGVSSASAGEHDAVEIVEAEVEVDAEVAAEAGARDVQLEDEGVLLEDEGVALEVDEPEPAPQPAAEPAPAPGPTPAAPASPRSAVSARTPDASARTRVAPARAADAPPAAPVEQGAAEDLSDEIDVADFFLEQGLVADARDALRALVAAHPDHRGVREKLEALERGGAAPAATSERRSEVDLAREIEDDLGGVPIVEEEFQYSVEDVFDQFKKGVEQTVRPEDSATHYDLGIAYREMGLLDDAVHELETALRGSDRRRDVDCLSMLGACHMARGQPREAIAVLQQALASPHLTREAAKALHFDLGDAHEAAGERERALQCFRKVSQLDAAYRGVAARLAALAGGDGRQEPDGEARTAGSNGAAAPAGPAGAPTRKKNVGYL